MNTLVVAEHHASQLHLSTRQTITAAQQLGQPITVLVAGHHCRLVAEQVSAISGVTRVVLADHAVYAHQLPENVALLIHSLIDDNVTHVLAPATTTGKNYLPRVAALLHVAPLSDVIRVQSKHIFERYIYAGNAIATVRSLDNKQMMTIRSSAFVPAELQETSAPIDVVDSAFDAGLSTFAAYEPSVSLRPDLSTARVIVSGGRGLQSAENFTLLETLADCLGAAIGASRAAVDAGFVPNDYQVGQTGKIVAPDLYIAIGISGAIQHVAGIKGSKVIVAINQDPDAPIFNVADYGLVGDLFTIIPILSKALKN